MNRVFVDMDGVLVNFEKRMEDLHLSGDELKRVPGAYVDMPAYPEGLAGVRTLIGAGYEVWIATKPPTGISWAYGDKAEWVLRNLPELKRRIIITHDKGLLGDNGDYLIDDRPHKANCETFRGDLIRFGQPYMENWSKVIEYLLDQRKFNGLRYPSQPQ